MVSFQGLSKGSGELFKFKGEDTTVTELVVFITPQIVRHAAMTESEGRLYEMTNFGGPKMMFTEAEKEAEK